MPISPNSTAHLLGVPLGENQKHQIRFTDIAAQYAYFYGKKKKTIQSGCKYIKGTDSVFTVPFCKDDIITCNYIMYKNTAYGTKWFYAFITDIEYVNDSASNITIKIDVYQTWLFDVDLKQSFVERWHIPVDSDNLLSIGNINENLDTGDTFYTVDKVNILTDDIVIIVASITDWDGTVYDMPQYSNIVSGYSFFAFNNDIGGLTTLRTFIRSIPNDENISFIFLVPKCAVPTFTDGDNIESCEVIQSEFQYAMDLSTLYTFAPKNKKLYMYPYSYLFLSNNNGGNVIYRFEDFLSLWEGEADTLKFNVAANLSTEPRVLVTPKNYKGEALNYDESIILDGFPQCSWRNDFYKSWLATNGLSQALSVAGSIVSVAGGIASGNPLAIAAGTIGVAQTIGEFNKASLQPDNVKGSNKGSINAAIGNLNITLHVKSLKPAKMYELDSYFEMYGYKVNRVMDIPDHTRKYWNYVKTIDVCITGDIPPKDMNELKGIYNEGFTVWHDPSYYLDYSNDNHEE